MVNVTDINCPHCDHNKADTLAIIGRTIQVKDPNDKTKMIDKIKKIVVYRCLRCRNQFERNPKEHQEFKKFFKPETAEDAINNA